MCLLITNARCGQAAAVFATWYFGGKGANGKMFVIVLGAGEFLEATGNGGENEILSRSEKQREKKEGTWSIGRRRKTLVDRVD